MIIAGKEIAEGRPCFVIAEAGLNHNGDAEIAERLIECAAECGADAVKFQTYHAAELFPPDHPEYEKFRRMEFSLETYRRLATVARERDIILLSTPFDESSSDLLDEFGAPAIKVGSGELTHLDFLDYLSRKNKPIILSTGMSTLDRIDAAVRVIRDRPNAPDLALLHCVSAYPCPIEDANVRNLLLLRERYGLPVGYSDHTVSDHAPLAAVALGACVIEKHFTLSRHLPGWDHFFSYPPEALKTLIESIRLVETALGVSEKSIRALEENIEAIARRAIYARRDIEAGETFSRDNLVVRRPAGPMGAERFASLLGKRAARNIAAEDALNEEDVMS